MLERIVIVGGSLAGLRAAEALRAGGHTGALTIIGEERHLPYDRPPLSKQVLTGKVAPDGALLPIPDALGADWLLAARATGLDLTRRLVLLDDGTEVAFDGLVIATGARPRILPGAPPGPGVHYLRTLDDAIALAKDLSGSSGAVVIGAGFIGLEVASSAASLGVPVTVLEALPVPLERALGPQMGQAIMDWHLGKGMDIRSGVGVNELVLGAERPQGVRLHDGTMVAAETIVVGVGVIPCTDWLDGSGVDLMDGVVCDDKLRVLAEGKPVPGVVAAGDVARWSHPAYGQAVRIEHWTNATESAEAAAHTLLRGNDADPYEPVPYFWSDQHGIKMQFVGRAAPDDEVAVLEGSLADDRVVVAYGRSGRLVAALGMRRPARVMALQRAIGEGAPFPPVF
ncbi:MAG: FAD-dependent oxidoreductase [Acidimicrobiales bacterium]|nr:FAD-dependent oxidoreductase [Acidimicrobiales bacterium]